MKSFDFGGITFIVCANHFYGYTSLAEHVAYEETEYGTAIYATTWAREDCCPWEIEYSKD